MKLVTIHLCLCERLTCPLSCTLAGIPKGERRVQEHANNESQMVIVIASVLCLSPQSLAAAAASTHGDGDALVQAAKGSLSVRSAVPAVRTDARLTQPECHAGKRVEPHCGLVWSSQHVDRCGVRCCECLGNVG